jgi:hypothetical protein
LGNGEKNLNALLSYLSYMGSVLNNKEKNQPTPTERHAPGTVLEEEAELGCDFDTFDRLSSWPPYCEFVRHI